MTSTSTGAPACPLCGAVTRQSALVPGYQLPVQFPIRECADCNVSFAWPLAVPEGFYDLIYDQRSRLRAYDTYSRIAAEIRDQERPLEYLAGEGPCYWGIRQSLEHTPPGARILEIGCGLGYMTFALSRAGYDATGVDISERAVDEARNLFGDMYRRADLADLAREEPGRYDAIVLTELLEHVPEPIEFLRTLVPLLAPTGRILLTTPNKSAFPAGTLWQTDLPPVHLWWFSEPSMRALAKRLELAVTLVDYSADTRGHGRSLRVKWPAEEVYMPPQLDADGVALPEPTGDGVQRYFPGEQLGLRHLLRWVQYKLNPSRRARQTSRRATMTAVLERAGAPPPGRP